AFVVRGNVRYLPQSEPIAFIDTDGQPGLCVRTSRVTASGTPTQTTQLEFRKRFSIACIGADIPDKLLARLGTPLVSGGPANQKRCVVNPLLETRQPNLYLAGDVLLPSYFETTDFSADPSSFTEIKRKGNIKAALRDGVVVAGAIAQRLAGQQVIVVDAFDGAPSGWRAPSRPGPQPAAEPVSEP